MSLPGCRQGTRASFHLSSGHLKETALHDRGRFGTPGQEPCMPGWWVQERAATMMTERPTHRWAIVSVLTARGCLGLVQGSSSRWRCCIADCRFCQTAFEERLWTLLLDVPTAPKEEPNGVHHPKCERRKFPGAVLRGCIKTQPRTPTVSNHRIGSSAQQKRSLGSIESRPTTALRAGSDGRVDGTLILGHFLTPRAGRAAPGIRARMHYALRCRAHPLLGSRLSARERSR